MNDCSTCGQPTMHTISRPYTLGGYATVPCCEDCENMNRACENARIAKDAGKISREAFMNICAYHGENQMERRNRFSPN